jgi:hypothetical protein
MTDRIPYKGRTLDVFVSGDEWMIEITDALGRRSIPEARTLERVINAAYQIDEAAAVTVLGASLTGHHLPLLRWQRRRLTAERLRNSQILGHPARSVRVG